MSLSTLSFKVLIWFIRSLASFVVMLAAMTALDTPQALPRALQLCISKIITANRPFGKMIRAKIEGSKGESGRLTFWMGHKRMRRCEDIN